MTPRGGAAGSRWSRPAAIPEEAEKELGSGQPVHSKAKVLIAHQQKLTEGSRTSTGTSADGSDRSVPCTVDLEPALLAGSPWCLEARHVYTQQRRVSHDRQTSANNANSHNQRYPQRNRGGGVGSSPVCPVIPSRDIALTSRFCRGVKSSGHELALVGDVVN